jgi:hypothetical protein
MKRLVKCKFCGLHFEKDIKDLHENNFCSSLCNEWCFNNSKDAVCFCISPKKEGYRALAK